MSARGHASPLDAFQKDYARRTKQNREMLDHLLHNAFPGDAAAEPEVDLVNDPDPPPERIQEVLGRYPFEDIPAAYQNLMALATEKIRFLRRAAAGIFWRRSPRGLLAAIAKTPEPDTTLVNLSRVSDSLGGKAALWELLSTNQPSLNLYVTLCAACPYLAGILTSNPGMIDELMDSLLVSTCRRLRFSKNRWPSCAKGPRTSIRFCTASRTPSTCASACATCSARTTSARRTRRWPISPRRASSKSPSAST